MNQPRVKSKKRFLSQKEMFTLTEEEQKKLIAKRKAEENRKALKLSFQEDGLFLTKPANEWIEEAKKTKQPNQLFGEFWFENEISILFADTNVGKSILAVQIADSISRGKEIEGFTLSAPKQSVLYFDFELTKKQFENRYSVQYENHYSFNDNLRRIEINPEFEFQEGKEFEVLLKEAIENAVKVYDSKVLIVDNLTYLKGENEKAKDALPFMKMLKKLKNTYSLSMLILAHTPKRDLSRPINENDLQGSKMIANFCDTMFAIGQSQIDTNLRYLKQLKVRNVQKKYDSNNVVICKIEKPYNFLGFTFINTDFETKHLKVLSQEDREERKEEARTLKSQGLTNQEIGDKFGVSESAVRKWFKD